MARYRSDAFPSCRPWQDCAPMRSRRGLGRGKHRFAATYRRHVFRYSLFWQDMRAMYPKSPAERRWGMHRANILPPRGAFAVRSPQIMHGARILPPSGGPAPGAGAPARATASQDRPSTAWPLLRDAHPGAPPIPATCRCPPLAVPVAARGKPPMSFGGGHPAHGIQFGQAPRDRRLRHLDGRADNGVLRRTGPGFRNREQVGAEPQAEAAGPAGPASALPKTPIERTGPSWRSYRNTPKIATKVAFLGCPWPSLRQPQFHQPSRSCARSSRSINATPDFLGCHWPSSYQGRSRFTGPA